MSLQITEHQIGDVHVLECVGRITEGEGACSFRNSILLLVYGTTRPLSFEEKRAMGRMVNILVKLWDVSYVDSSGIGEMVSGFTTVNNHGGWLQLFAARNHFAELMRRGTKLATVWEKKGRPETNMEVQDAATAMRVFAR